MRRKKYLLPRKIPAFRPRALAALSAKRAACCRRSLPESLFRI
jgi:hypothetical protein